MFEGLLLPWQQIYHFCFYIQFLEQLLKFLANFTLLKYVKSQRSYGFLIRKKLIFGFQILDLKDHFSASLRKFVILRHDFFGSDSKLMELQNFSQLILDSWFILVLIPSCNLLILDLV